MFNAVFKTGFIKQMLICWFALACCAILTSKLFAIICQHFSYPKRIFLCRDQRDNDKASREDTYSNMTTQLLRRHMLRGNRSIEGQFLCMLGLQEGAQVGGSFSVGGARYL